MVALTFVRSIDDFKKPGFKTSFTFYVWNGGLSISVSSSFDESRLGQKLPHLPQGSQRKD